MSWLVISIQVVTSFWIHCYIHVFWQHLQILERDLLAEETTIPVYFALETEELSSIYEEIHRGNAGDQASTAIEGIESLS